jgi:hypothetical protein
VQVGNMPNNLDASVVLGLNIYIWIFAFKCFFEISEWDDQAASSEDHQRGFVDLVNRRTCAPAGEIYKAEYGGEKDGGNRFHVGSGKSPAKYWNNSPTSSNYKQHRMGGSLVNPPLFLFTLSPILW